MPIPVPRKGEKQSNFTGRCMGNATMNAEYPKTAQRFAICIGSWRKKKEAWIRIMNFLRYLKTRKKESSPKKKREAKEFGYHFAGQLIREAFVSLDSALRAAVRKKFGKNHWVTDFSNREVVYYKQTEAGIEMSPEGETVYNKMTYRVSKGEAELTGVPVRVKRVTTYKEGRLSVDDYLELSAIEDSIIYKDLK